jgi:hypothetical protein
MANLWPLNPDPINLVVTIDNHRIDAHATST